MASGREDLASARDGNSPASLIFYSVAYVGAAHHFDTTRKAGWVAASLSAHPIAGVSMAEPAPLTADKIAAVHDRTYVDAVRTGQPRELATSSGLGWDAGVWNAVCASNGGAVAAKYLPTLRRRLSALSGTAFDVVIYNAGMDVHEECAIGGLTGVTDAILAEREQTVFDWARAQGVPVAFVLAGGYVSPRLQQHALVGLHRLTVAAMVLRPSESQGAR